MPRKGKTTPAARVPERFRLQADLIAGLADSVDHADARAGLLHLADLFRHCPRFYPNVPIRQGDVLPYRPSSATTSGIGSPAAMCAEG